MEYRTKIKLNMLHGIYNGGGALNSHLSGFSFDVNCKIVI